MQNKPNFRKSQMNVNKVLTRDYEKMDTWSSGKNKPKTNPKQTQFKPNSNPIQSQYKPKQTQCLPATPLGRACPPSVWRHKGKKMYLRDPKYLTITNMGDNFKKCIVFLPFLERTLFGR